MESPSCDVVDDTVGVVKVPRLSHDQGEMLQVVEQTGDHDMRHLGSDCKQPMIQILDSEFTGAEHVVSGFWP